MDINATILGQFLSFFIFVVICWKYVWPPLRDVMVEREKTISKGLQDAEEAERSLVNAKSKASDLLNEAKGQAAELIEQANRRANQIVDAAKDQAKVEAVRIKGQADSEVQQQVNRAREALREQVSLLAVAGAKKILRAEIDKSKHGQLLKELSAEL